MTQNNVNDKPYGFGRSYTPLTLSLLETRPTVFQLRTRVPLNLQNNYCLVKFSSLLFLFSLGL